MKIGCLGPAGSYSEVAAKKLSPDAEVVLFRNFPAVVAALRTGACRRGWPVCSGWAFSAQTEAFL